MKKRRGEPWMTPAAYARTLRGFKVNLLVRDVAAAAAFQAAEARAGPAATGSTR